MIASNSETFFETLTNLKPSLKAQNRPTYKPKKRSNPAGCEKHLLRMSKKAKKKAAMGSWGVVDEDDKYIKALLSKDDPAKLSMNFEPPNVDEDILVESQYVCSFESFHC